jgi:hypothetical protein
MSYKRALKLVPSYGGLKTGQFTKALRQMGFKVNVKRMSLRQALDLSKNKTKAITVLYKWVHGKRQGGHYVLLTPKGGINTSRRSRINQQRWNDTLKHWGRTPRIYIIEKI